MTRTETFQQLINATWCFFSRHFDVKIAEIFSTHPDGRGSEQFRPWNHKRAGTVLETIFHQVLFKLLFLNSWRNAVVSQLHVPFSLLTPAFDESCCFQSGIQNGRRTHFNSEKGDNAFEGKNIWKRQLTWSSEWVDQSVKTSVAKPNVQSQPPISLTRCYWWWKDEKESLCPKYQIASTQLRNGFWKRKWLRMKDAFGASHFHFWKTFLKSSLRAQKVPGFVLFECCWSEMTNYMLESSSLPSLHLTYFACVVLQHLLDIIFSSYHTFLCFLRWHFGLARQLKLSMTNVGLHDFGWASADTDDVGQLFRAIAGGGIRACSCEHLSWLQSNAWGQQRVLHHRSGNKTEQSKTSQLL